MFFLGAAAGGNRAACAECASWDHSSHGWELVGGRLCMGLFGPLDLG